MVFIKFNKKIVWKDKLCTTNLNDKYYIKSNGRIINNYENIKYDLEEIEIFPRICGGKKKKKNKIPTPLDILTPILKPIIKPINIITKSVLNISKLVIEILKLFPNLALALVSYLTKPEKLLEEIIHGILEGVKLIFTDNSVGPKKKKKSYIEKKENKNYCFKTKLLKILLLIGFPPLAIFIDRGIKGIVPIVISTILTFKFYYLPGLIYTSIYLLL